MHRPGLHILDVPTAGVDIDLRADLWDYIRGLHADGTTVLLTTHYLEEAEELCQEIILLRGGRILARGSAQTLRTSFGAQSITGVYAQAMALADVEQEAVA